MRYLALFFLGMMAVACANVSGVRAGDPKTNGAPPPLTDRDADGIPDNEDACPDTAGAKTNDRATSGCPSHPMLADRDHDLIPDAEDACPDVQGVAASDPKTNGCPPTLDRDADGVLDADDACPEVPGIRTQDSSTNGCPRPSNLVHVAGNQIVLGDVIHFDTDSPHVHRASWPILKKIAEFIRANPDIQMVDIQGNADEVGTTEHNLYLSRERAAAVKQLLVYFGVDPEELSEQAHGKDRPRWSGHDEKARRGNRRVEFTITRARQRTASAQTVDVVR